ncbi:general substrate transporter [Lipomyces chichibuensis]|uniref:general substrate transporter n=1 Tax=Lipomyces chichibuensis TaxID=1546026 RepID=UPI003343A576
MVRLLNVYTISAFAALGGALFGFDISSMSAVIGTEQYQNYYGNPLGMRQGAITSAMAGGSLVGALSSSFLGDRLSRKVAIQIGAALWCIGSAVQSASNGVVMLVIGLALAGLCVGLTSSLVPIYQSEIVPRKIRGRIVSLQQFAITWGIMVQYFIEYGCSFLESTASFRLPWAIQTVPAVVLFVGLFWFPRSPRWLASKDRWDEALRVLAFLRSAHNDVNAPLVLAEYKEIEDQISQEREEESNSYRELFSSKIRKRVLLSMAIQMWSQLTGINVMMYYIVYILESAGIANSMLASSIQYIINMVMTIPSILWADKWGRRPAFLIGAIVMGFWLFLIGGLLMHYGESNRVLDQPYTWIIVGHHAATRIILASAYLAVATFALSWGPVSWMYPPEIVPLRIRAKSVALATASNWASNFALGFAVPPLLRSIQWRLFFIFGSFNMAAFIHVWFAAPETKQRTLEELGEIFEYGEPLWKSFLGNRRGSNKLDMLAKDIEIGVSKINRSEHVKMKHVISEDTDFRS